MAYQPKSYRKFMATSLSAAVVASVAAPVASQAAESFTDVPSGSYYADAVMYLTSEGHLNGYGDGTFKPMNDISRAEAAKVLMSAKGLVPSGTENYSDVNSGNWFYDAVRATSNAGIFEGYEGKFNPEGELTREAAAKIIVEAYGLTGGGATPFKDVSGWSESYIEVAYNNGIIKGVTDTSFDPKANVKRADFAVMIHRAIEATAAPAVTSVSAINAKEVVVKLNKALASDTTEADLLTAFSLEGKTDSKAVLSTDRKSVTYTLDNTEVSNATVTVLPLETAEKDSNGDAIKTNKFVSVMTYKDTVAPTVSGTDYTYNADGTANAKVSFTEDISTAGTVSINGVETTPTVGADSITLSNLEVGKSYTVDIVGAYDTATAPNKAEHLTLSFTVPSETVDSDVPTVTTSVNGNKLSLTFSEEVTKGIVTIGGVKVDTNDLTTTDNKTFTVDVQKANSGSYFSSNTKFFTSEVVVKDFADKAKTPNTMKEVKFNATFTADTTAASLSSASAKADGTIILEFNEEVLPNTVNSLTVKTIDGIQQTSKSFAVATSNHVIIDGKPVKNKLELVLADSTSFETGKNYNLDVAAQAISDNYDNKNSKEVNFTVVRPVADGAKPGAVVTTTISEDNNVIDITFAGTHKDGMSNSALNTSNYTIGGKVLPSNTDIKFLNDRNHVQITLPESFVTVNGDYTFKASNLTDQFGNTLAKDENTAQLTLDENVAPTVKSSLTVNGSNELVVDFSEAIKSVDLDSDGNFFEGITVKVNGKDAGSSYAVDANGDLKVTLTDAINLSDSVTVEFKDAELTDNMNNQLKDGVSSK
ncbi:S-layer homology domain-containing protein [Bacillus sp. Marseille-Q3570]|uniref:S-layer homology domain-containing protein n=1 Tax=Bacillus sp. Marseille-Q3570 TaxID=2963522 RepID=UPI0021B78EFB|nr:S-layer homology domain-containing protein [Bacillus sp. Marseille-Q3570]